MEKTMNRILIKNGRVVTPKAVVDADILVKGETIARIAPHLAATGARVIDADGKIVLPGGIDVHTHFNLDVGIVVARDDFYTGTVAAAMGGTTTIIDHPGFGPDGCSIFHQIDQYHEFAGNHAVIDYSFHGVLQHLDDQVIKDIPKLADQGITSMKAYMTYGHMFTDDMLARLFEVSAGHGILIAVHAEDDPMVQSLRKLYVSQGKTKAVWHALSRPNQAEAIAVRHVIDLAQKTDAPLYIVHLSTKEGLEAVKTARQSGRRVFAETCPQYLVLDEKAYQLPDHEGLKFIMSPPLRSLEDQAALWQGLEEGFISVVATDHCPFDFELKKQMAAHDFSRCPGGAPGVEARFPLMFSRAAVQGRMGLIQFCRIMSENPARLMGLYPKKGILAPGSDADIVLMDLEKRVVITHDLLHENVDYTPYEGFQVNGWPVLTMVRGQVVVENSKFKGRKGFGRFIKRKQFLNIL